STQATGSNAKSSTGSGENDQAASSDEATSSEPIPVPPNDAPTLVGGEPNRWCVEGQWQIYRDANMKSGEFSRGACTLFQTFTGCSTFTNPGTYSEEIDREFYASYAATPRGSISKRSKPLAQDPLTSTLVRGCPVDISPATIRRFLYGPTTGHSWSINTAEFDYRWDIRNSEQRKAVIHWLAKYIAADGERAEWVVAPCLGIRKATLTFVAKFFWLLVHNRVSPTEADNQVTWDRAVMVAALVAGVEIDFARMLLAEIHERAFRTSTTYPFPCLIFQLCQQGLDALDIDLIRDEANVAAPRREPQVEAASMGPSSCRSTPQLGAAVVPLARVQKLEAQRATLLHYIQPWMQKTIAESEARVERRMEDMMDRKVQAVNNRQTLQPDLPNVILNVCGEAAHISVCCPKKPGLFTIICYVVEKHKIDIVSAQISSDQFRSMFMIQAHAKGGSRVAQFSGAFTMEDMYKQAANEIILLTTPK
ncbi:hypothetical protein H5410_010389, partial [Solanum commersonii]